MARPKKSDIHGEIVRRGTKNINHYFKGFRDNIDRFKECSTFVYADDAQWDQSQKEEYRKESKPRKSYNYLVKFNSNAVSELDAGTPDFKVRGAEDREVPQEAIDATNDIMRTISYSSRTELAYQRCKENMIKGGFGAIRLVVEFESPESFNMVTRIRDIPDPLSCAWDLSAKMFDKSDGRFCAQIVTMSKEVFKEKYPKVDTPISFVGPDNTHVQWETKDVISVADYYEKKPVKKTIMLLSTGQVVFEEELDDVIAQVFDQTGEAPEIVQTRSTVIDEIMFYRFTHNALLEQSKWDGDRLPIIYGPGASTFIGPDEITRPLVWFSLDSQRDYNFIKSDVIYRLGLTRYEPYIVTEGMIANYNEMWANAHKAKSALIYKVDPEAPGAEPRRQQNGGLPQEFFAALSLAGNEMQSIQGTFEANLGMQGNEISGVAVQERRSAGNSVIQVYNDNWIRIIESVGRTLLGLIPKVYDNTRTMNLISEEGKETQQTINGIGDDGEPTNKITGHKYDIRVSVGPNADTQRDQEFNKMIQIGQIDPEALKVNLDLLIENSNLKNAPKMKDRVQTWVIPQITQTEMQGLDDEQVIAQNNQAKQEASQKAAVIQQATLHNSVRDSLSKQMTGQANIMNAQTNQFEAEGDSQINAQKAQAEQFKAAAGVREQELKLQQEMLKGATSLDRPIDL